MNDPILNRLCKHINDISEMCNAHIKPWEPDAGPRAVRLCNELAKPYIDYMCEYDAIDRSTFFDPVIYDTTVASQREELKGIFVNDFDTLSVDERIDLADARELCIH